MSLKELFKKENGYSNKYSFNRYILQYVRWLERKVIDLEERLNKEVTDVCICVEATPYATGKYAGHCQKCGLPMPMPR